MQTVPRWVTTNASMRASIHRSHAKIQGVRTPELQPKITDSIRGFHQL
jgi:hypothetical protein